MKNRINLLFVILLLSMFVFACSSDDGANDGDGDGDNDSIDGDTETTESDQLADGDAENMETADGDTDGDQDQIEGDIEQDSDIEGDQAYTYPDHNFIYELRTQDNAMADQTYSQEFVEFFRTTEQLGGLNVNALARLGDSIYAGTTVGIYRKKDTDTVFSLLPSDKLTANIVAIDRNLTSDGKLIAVSDDVVHFFTIDESDKSGYSSLAYPPGGINAVAHYLGDAVIATDNGALIVTEGMTGLINSTTDMEVRDVIVDDNDVVYLATASGVKIHDPAKKASGTWTMASGDLVDDDVRSLAACGSRIVAGSLKGIAIHDADTITLLDGSLGELPTDQVISLDCNDTGILIGHKIGATFLSADFSHKDHYASGRWMPGAIDWDADMRTPAVALNNTERWIGTQKGASRIYLEERTLAEKAAVFEDYVDKFWRMGGFVASDASLNEGTYGDPLNVRLSDKDNDGLWTQMMIGGWCFAHAVTGEDKFYQQAKKAMDNMYMLVDFPEITFSELGKNRGFVSRSIVRDDEGAIYDNKLAEGELVDAWDVNDEDGKKDILRWNPVTVGDHDYLWKADTSSDEYAGHMFGFPIYYDLCADDTEKQKLADYVSDAVHYIIDGGYLLIDMDGTHTMHGHWDPESISICIDSLEACIALGYSSDVCMNACFSGNYGGGWLNSLEILGTLLAAYHMTGEKEFYDSYEYLIRVHRYDEMAMAHDEIATIAFPALANHSDHELAMLAYTTLIRYDANPERRAKWIESLEFLHNFDRELGERNPWWSAVCAISGCDSPDIPSSVRTLQEIPDDIRKWLVDISHRTDHTVIGVDRHGDQQVDVVHPYDEIRTVWWNGNMYNIRQGGNGAGLAAPTFWLLPYYMSLYTGMISE